MKTSLINQIFIGAASLILMGCGFSDSQSNRPITTAKALPLGVDSSNEARMSLEGGVRQRTIGDIQFDIPASWEEKSLSSTVLLAEYQLPGEAGPGRLTFSTAGGGQEANLDRWKQQFRRGADDPEPKVTAWKVADKNSVLIELTGTFSDMFGGSGPKEHWKLLGVAIPLDAEHSFFIKLTGPEETLAARREEFLDFLNKAHF